MLTIEVLIEYPDPMDNCLPPQIYIREWREVELTPKEWYRVLASPVVFIKLNTGMSDKICLIDKYL